MDRERAEWIASQLVEAGYTVFLQAWDIRPGSNFVLEMQRAAAEVGAKRALLEGVKRGRISPDENPEYRDSPSRAITTESVGVAMPSVWNVPHLRNPNFTGREEELAELRASLINQDHPGTYVLASVPGFPESGPPPA